MKQNRHERIIEIINANDIETQDELLAKLREDGFDVTQATISRDIKTGIKTILKETIVRADYAQNIVVLKTYSGMAQAAAAAIDSLQMQDIVGSVAGDDTILIVMRSDEIARDFTEKYKELLH